MEEHLYTLLSGAVAFPIAWGALGEGTSTPRAALFRVSGDRTNLNLQAEGLMRGRVQIDCYGKTYAEAIVASREIRAALERYQGGPVQGVYLDAIRDLNDDDAGLLFRVSLSFLVIYEE